MNTERSIQLKWCNAQHSSLGFIALAHTNCTKLVLKPERKYIIKFSVLSNLSHILIFTENVFQKWNIFHFVKLIVTFEIETFESSWRTSCMIICKTLNAYIFFMRDARAGKCCSSWIKPTKPKPELPMWNMTTYWETSVTEISSLNFI